MNSVEDFWIVKTNNNSILKVRGKNYAAAVAKAVKFGAKENEIVSVVNAGPAPETGKQKTNRLIKSRKKNPAKVRDPEHKKLVRELRSHFSKDEAELKRMRKNPDKFDRCVKAVKKSAKKRGKKVNAYAVCNSATKKHITINEKKGAEDAMRGSPYNPPGPWHGKQWFNYTSAYNAASESQRKKTKRNPLKRPNAFVIAAKATGKKMFFDGKNFSENTRPKKFLNAADAMIEGRRLVKQFPILRRYRVTVENYPKR